MRIIIFIGLFLVVSAQEQPQGTRSTNCTCGVRNLRRPRRIVAGNETLPNEFPFMAGIYYKDEDVELVNCGGSILTRRHVLTAAHCVFETDTTYLTVLVGIHNYTKREEWSQKFDISMTFEHPDYNETETGRVGPDISIILLRKPISFNQNVGPACLPKQRIDLLNKTVTVLGWGKTSYDGEVSKVLRKVDLTVVKCGFNTTNDICTSADVKDSCKGDSGGPVLWLDPETNRYVVVGVISRGYECAKTHGVNVEVAPFLDFIQRHISYVYNFNETHNYVRLQPSNMKTCA